MQNRGGSGIDFANKMGVEKEGNWMEEFLANSPEIILRIGNRGTVLYTNRAGETLLEFWNIRAGEKLPPDIGKIVRNVVFRKKAEKMELRAGKKVYSVTLTSPAGGEYAVIYGSDITSLKQTEEKLRMRDRQHEALSRLGELALKVPDLEDMIKETTALVSSTLEVKYCKILKLLPYESFRLGAGVGWKKEVGTVLKKKTGLNASGMSVLIGSREKPFGLILVHSKEKRNFTKEDTYFLNSVSVLISETIERKEMEEALRYKVNFLETLLDAIPAPVFYKDKEGIYRGCNELFARRVMGLPKERVIGRSIDELKEKIPVKLGTVYKKMDGQLLRKGGVQFYESKVMCSDWVERDFFFNKATYKDFSGKVEGIVGVMLDITGRKRTEEHLQKSEERYRLIAEQTGQLIYELDLRNSTVEWAGAVQELTDYSYKEIQNFNFYDWLEHIHPEDRKRVQKELRKCWKSGKKFHEEFRFRRKDGSYFFVENKGVYQRDEDGQVCRALGVMKDVTGIKIASEKLKESEERYRSFLQNFKGIAFKLDMNFDPIFLHGAVEEISGYREEDFLSGRVRLLESVDPEDRQMILESRNKIKSDPDCILEHEYRIRRKDGEVRWVHDIVHNICGPSGEIMFIQGSIYDITERKVAEEALATAEKIRLKEIHHRIKNNLQVVSSLLNLQADKFKDKEVVKAFRESENRVISMSLIHEKLYKSGDMESIDFADYLRKLSTELLRSYSVGDKKIQLQMNMENIYLGMDTAIPMGIVLNELFSNSLKYAFPEKREGEILISLKCEPALEKEGECKLPVSGNGGRAPEKEQLYTLIYSDNGVGLPEGIDLKENDSLGLKLVNALVDQIEGSIELENGAGSTFKITFKDIGWTPGTEQSPAMIGEKLPLPETFT